MNKQRKDFHPVTKACAMLGAVICGFFAVTLFVSSLFTLPDILTALVGCAKAVLIAILGRAFWFAGS
ncbi:hypothetical protein FX988_00115 [Paraglaciecola mesophila]|uniref:Uncharacterized protein n=1 Tax=Paraglaciecola mesophila TaxID=197222 RepID=A0A857JG95_9ALTE|nr:hypothetical protein [Paraglaciecola mesophila]QHJ09907.1 hypothetical protein FX988_00115 [Paraglaciecola mesophila]